MNWRDRIGTARYRPNEYPLVWLLAEHPMGRPGTAVRGGTHEPTDVAIALRRRPGAQEYSDPLWYKRRRAPLTVPALELDLAQPLPDICPVHGRPAVSRPLVRSAFYDTSAHPRHPQPGRRTGREPTPVSTLVAGEWPLCDRCTRKRRWFHAAAGLLLVAMALNLIAMILAAQVLDYPPLVVPTALGVLPGSFPIGLVIALLLYERGETHVQLRPLDDERFLRVDAHPNFAAALHRLPPPAAPQSAPLPRPRYRIENGRVVPE